MRDTSLDCVLVDLRLGTFCPGLSLWNCPLFVPWLGAVLALDLGLLISIHPVVTGVGVLESKRLRCHRVSLAICNQLE